MPYWAHPQNQTLTDPLCGCFLIHARTTPGFEGVWWFFAEFGSVGGLLEELSEGGQFAPPMTVFFERFFQPNHSDRLKNGRLKRE